jgi:putative nucleotidyltransferase with HDIG domain
VADFQLLDGTRENFPSEVTTDELSSIMPALAEMLAKCVDADCCSVFAYDEDQQSTLSLFRYGYDETSLGARRWADRLPPRQIPAERHVISTRQPLIRSTPGDFEQFPLANPDNQRVEGRLTDLTIPLLWNDHVQGIAYIWKRFDAHRFTESEIQTALDLGQLAAMTIVFSRQYAHERLQRIRLETMLGASDLSVSGTSVDAILAQLANSMRKVTAADVCSIYIFDENQDDILASYLSGVAGQVPDVQTDHRTTPVHLIPAEVQMLETRVPSVIRDFEREFGTGGAFIEALKGQGISEALLLPIIWQGDVLGAVYCWYRQQQQQFSVPVIEIATAVAQQAGGVAARSQLEHTIQRQTLESEALQRIGQAVLVSETLPPVLEEIAACLNQLIPYSYASFAMLTDDDSHLEVIHEWGGEYYSVQGEQIPVDASISGMAITSRQVINLTNVAGDQRAWKRMPSGKPIYSMMVTPLTYDNRVLGTLMLARRDERPFDKREEQLLTLLSQQAAVAVERVRSREMLVKRAQRQAFLARVGDHLVGYEEPFEALPRIAELISQSVADGVVVGLAGWGIGEIAWVADASNDSETAEFLHAGLEQLNSAELREGLEQILSSNDVFVLTPDEMPDEHRFLFSLLEQIQAKQIAALPLYHRERALGVMILFQQHSSEAFTEDEIELAKIVAERIGDAVERHNSKRNHETLLRVAEALHKQVDVGELVRTIARELERILPCDQMIIADLDENQRLLHTQIYRHGGYEAPGKAYFSVEEGICGEAVRTLQPIMDNKADRRGSSFYGSSYERAYYRAEGESVLVTPLIVENEVIGVLFMNRTGHNRFTMSEFETFMLFAGLASAALDRTTLEQHNRELYRASTEVLAAVVDAKDPTTLEHSRHVAHYSRELANLLHLTPLEVERIELAGLLHDIGKLGIPDRILQKPGKLSDEEFALIKTHPDRGASILGRHPALTDLIPMIRHHHEAYNGRGYPAGLEGEEIPIGASIICIADAFDTMTTERTYQPRRSIDAALEELHKCAGAQFHPDLVERFIERVRADRSILMTSEL